MLTATKARAYVRDGDGRFAETPGGDVDVTAPRPGDRFRFEGGLLLHVNDDGSGTVTRGGRTSQLPAAAVAQVLAKPPTPLLEAGRNLTSVESAHTREDAATMVRELPAYSFPADVAAGVRSYQHKGYKGNGELRAGKDPADVEEHGASMVAMDAALADPQTALPVPVTLYRGMSAKRLADGDLVGTELADDAFLSGSYDPKIGEEFATGGAWGSLGREGAVIVMRVPAGTHAIAMERATGKTVGAPGSETELVLGRKTRTRVVEDLPRSAERPYRQVTVEVVPAA